MTLLQVLGVAALTLILMWAGLILLGLVRQVDELDRRLTLVTAAMPGKINRLGLPVRAVVPSFEARTLDGVPWQSSSLAGQEHLILFAHPRCAPCEDLVPKLVREVGHGRLPRLVIVSEGAPDEHPQSWRDTSGSDGRVTILLQDRHSVAKLMESFVTPHFFFVGPDNRIVAQGIATSVEEVKVISRRGRHQRTKDLEPASP